MPKLWCHNARLFTNVTGKTCLMFQVNRRRMSREEYERYYKATILLILFVVASGSKTGYQQRYRRFESLNSCFVAEYAHWRKLEQVVIFEHPRPGKISVR